MKKLCFGSFATVLVRCKANSTTQKKLCGTMLLPFDPTNDLRTADGVTSALAKGSSNLSSIITDAVKAADINKVVQHFMSEVVPLLDNNKKSNIFLALKDIIASDDSIAADTVVECVNNITKDKLATYTTVVFHEFLAGVFLYLALYLDNRNCGAAVKEITDEYIQSFEPQKFDVTFIKQHLAFSAEIADEFAIDAHSLALLSETRGTCQKCSRILGIKKEGTDISYAKVVRLFGTDDVILCVECERELQNASEAEKMELLAEKRELETRSAAIDAVSRHEIERRIEDVLREIDGLEVSDDTMLKIKPVKVEQKITEKRLKENILSDVNRLYEGVNSSLDRLSGENKLNVARFTTSIRRMYEDASENLTSQSEIYNLLVDTLFEKSGRKYKEACAIIISYFVQSCEVFNEITE
ncbi:MAG: hypothetical protein RR415_13105 [Ruthenibacterium sp.]